MSHSPDGQRDWLEMSTFPHTDHQGELFDAAVASAYVTLLFKRWYKSSIVYSARSRQQSKGWYRKRGITGIVHVIAPVSIRIAQEALAEWCIRSLEKESAPSRPKSSPECRERGEASVYHPRKLQTKENLDEEAWADGSNFDDC